MYLLKSLGFNAGDLKGEQSTGATLSSYMLESAVKFNKSVELIVVIDERGRLRNLE